VNALLLGIALAVYLLAVLWWLGKLRETHHGYYALPLLIAGTVMQWPWLQWVAIGLLLDDACEHTVQLANPDVHFSPLLWLYGATLYKVPWVRRLNAWLDRRLS